MIRTYSPKDKKNALQLLESNVPTYFAAAEVTDYAQYLEHEREDYFVIEEKGVVVAAGGINYFPQLYKARLSWDMVHPDYHGKGLGKILVNHRFDIIRKQVSYRTVEVRTSQVVFRFYEKMGFNLVHTTSDFWAEGLHLYQMILTL